MASSGTTVVLERTLFVEQGEGPVIGEVRTRQDWSAAAARDIESQAPFLSNTSTRITSEVMPPEQAINRTGDADRIDLKPVHWNARQEKRR